MSRHLSPETVEMFAARRLAPEESVETAHHLAVCEECRVKVGEARSVHTQAQFIRDDLQREPLTHLSYEQLEGYVDESLEEIERDIVTNHLICCQACADEARELALLRDSLSVYPIVTKSPEPSPRLWQTLTALFAPKPLRIAAAGLVMLAIVAAGFIFLLSQKTGIVAENSAPFQSPSLAQGASASLQPPAPKPDSRTALPPEYERIVNQALTNQRLLRRAAISELIGRTGKLMSSKNDGERFALQSPIGTVIQTTRPVLRWQALKGATEYRVFILDDKFNLIAESPPLAGTSWQIPEHLKRGNLYLWQVTANIGDKEVTAPAAPMPEARFRVLGAAKANELEKIRRGKVTHLVLGTIYAHGGLLDEAERELRIAAGDSQDAALAKKLLRSLKILRRKGK